MASNSKNLAELLNNDVTLTTADIADGAITLAKTSGIGGGGKNLIINGDMRIAQRGTSQTAAGYGSLDRFELSLSGATATMTQESFTIGQTDVPGSQKYLKLAVSTGNNNSGIYYKVEARDAVSLIGGKATISYYAKGTSPAAGLEVAIGWYDGSTASPLASTSVTLTSSWVKYTHTFDVPSISGLTLTNTNAYLEVHWIQSNSDTGTGAYEVNLAQVQLEEGETATPFEFRSEGQDLALCQRYFSKVGFPSYSTLCVGQYTYNPSTNMGVTLLGGTPGGQMRVSPNMTFPDNSAGDFHAKDTGGGSKTLSGLTLRGYSGGGVVQCTAQKTGSGFGSDDVIINVDVEGASFHFDAEL